MKIIPCPICGNMPKITEGRMIKGKRRRFCGCPGLDSVIPCPDHLNRSWFVYIGEGDSNSIYKLWNLAVKRYNQNKNKDWFDRDYSPWSNDSHLQRW